MPKRKHTRPWYAMQTMQDHPFEGGPNDFRCKACNEPRAFHSTNQDTIGTAPALPIDDREPSQ